jgi:acetyl-CoA carboxylase biotin carboxyl carrier protein
MDLRKLKKLIDLVEESGIAELEVTEGEEKVRIVKNGGRSGGEYVMMQPQHMQQAPAAPAQETAPKDAPWLRDPVKP